MTSRSPRTERVSGSFWTPVVACILVTETAERFAYFGFRAVLVLYFTKALQYEDSTAIALFAYTTSLAYLAPIFGALLADGKFGRYTTILWFGAVYAIGLMVLTCGAYMDTEERLDLKRIFTFIGLFLVCVGTGGIKPCVSAFGADQVSHRNEDIVEVQTTEPIDTSLSPITAQIEASIKTEDDPYTRERVRAFFASFYFCINLGAVASIFLVPIIRAHFGFGAAFLTPTVFIMLAMVAFVSKSKEYVHHNPGQDGTSMATTFRLCGWLLRERIASNPHIDRYLPWLRPRRFPLPEYTDDDTVPSHSSHGSEEPASNQTLQLQDAAQALRVLPIMCLFPIFWMLYDQQGSVWTLQAERMSLHGLQPEQLNIVNPVEIMMFIPLFDRWIYPALEARGWNTSHLRRMAWGMVLASISFFASGILESVIEHREADGIEQVHVLWQLPQITILTVAEIFLSVTGLEFAYATSPDRLKAFLMALYLLTTAIGDFLGGVLYSSVFQELNRAMVMHVCAILMLGNLFLFCYVVQWWEGSQESQGVASARLNDTKRSISQEFVGYDSLDRTTSFKGFEMKIQKEKI